MRKIKVTKKLIKQNKKWKAERRALCKEWKDENNVKTI